MKQSINQIEYLATQFRREHLIGPLDPINCKRLIFSLNIFTLYRPMSENFSGMCIRNDDYRFMLINSNQNRGRQHFTIAHEIYHLFIQKYFITHICNPGLLDQSDPVETAANIFAACLLMPRDSIFSQIPEKELLDKAITLQTILKLEQFFSVSHSAMLVRLDSLDLITKNQKEDYSQLLIKKKTIEYGYDTSIYESGNEGLVIGDFGARTKELFESGKISESHYLDLMHSIGLDPTQNTNE
jgi:Zn-dependent peptidase ImmA (M78 family)